MSTNTNTTAANPLAAILEGFVVEVSNAREFRPDGQTKVYYSADAEVPTPGKRWSTLRVKVTSSTCPVPTGTRRIVLDGYDFKKGEGTAHVVE